MAQRVITQLVSDLSGMDIPEGEGTTVRFSVQGWEYEMDVTSKEAQQFDKDMAKYIGGARRIDGGSRRRSSGVSKPKTDKAQLQAMRQWLRDNGHEVSDRGRISAELQEIYNQAH